MNLPIKVTFDHNTYEIVVSPEKIISEKESTNVGIYRQIKELIEIKQIIPFLSETVLTIETLSREDRKKVLSRIDRMRLDTISEDFNESRIISKVKLAPNPILYPEKTDHFYKYLPEAINLGFKILPSFRLGKLINPEIKSNWYYTAEANDILEVPNKFASVVDYIEREGFGFAALKEFIGHKDSDKTPWIYTLKNFPEDKLGKLQKLVAEWSDADSIAIHIACGLKYFCTMDGSGKRNKDSSVLGKKMKPKLTEKYGIKFVTPEELIELV